MSLHWDSEIYFGVSPVCPSGGLHSSAAFFGFFRLRGGIENANGRLRRDLPRKASLTAYTDNDIESIVWNLNTTPRKCLGFKTPIEAFASHLGVALEM
jgi:hypothetical protein